MTVLKSIKGIKSVAVIKSIAVIKRNVFNVKENFRNFNYLQGSATKKRIVINVLKKTF